MFEFLLWFAGVLDISVVVVFFAVFLVGGFIIFELYDYIFYQNGDLKEAFKARKKLFIALFIGGVFILFTPQKDFMMYELQKHYPQKMEIYLKANNYKNIKVEK